MYIDYSLIIKKMLTKNGHIEIYGYRGSVCPLCGRVIALEDFYSEHCAGIPIAKSFRDALSWKEYEISGLCSSCQDNIFGVED
jgi:hypothetical protein